MKRASVTGLYDKLLSLIFLCFGDRYEGFWKKQKNLNSLFGFYRYSDLCLIRWKGIKLLIVVFILGGSLQLSAQFISQRI